MIINLDKYLLHLILDYLPNQQVGILQCTEKNLYKKIFDYQKHKINYILQNQKLSNSIINIINTNKNDNIYICNSKILENLIFKSIYLIDSSVIHKINYNTIFDEYRSCTSQLSLNLLYLQQLLFFQGEILAIFLNNIKVYNFLTEKWVMYDIYNFRNFICEKRCSIFNNNIYVTQSYFEGTNINYISDPLSILSFTDNKYVLTPLDPKTKLIQPRNSHAMITFENKLWIAGGVSRDSSLDTVEVFDFEIGIWKMENKMIRKRVNFKLYIINDKLYAIGGDVERNDSTISIEEFDNIKRIWILTTTKTIINYYTIDVLDGKIIIFNNQNYTCEVYDIKKNIWVTKRTNILINDIYLYSVAVKYSIEVKM